MLQKFPLFLFLFSITFPHTAVSLISSHNPGRRKNAKKPIIVQSCVKKKCIRSYYESNSYFREKYSDESDFMQFEESYNMGLSKMKILYSDDDIIVVDKPPQCQSVPGPSNHDSVATKVAKLYNQPRIDKIITHRLDYATSGVIIFARNDYSLRFINEQFRVDRSLKKKYFAIVAGKVCGGEGIIDKPLGKDMERGPPYCKVDEVIGKQSKTYWRKLDGNEDLTMLELVPKTGRTHQLRIHLASIGHPIVGDYFYAPSDIYKRSSRLLLHAYELQLMHPRTKQSIAFTASCSFSLNSISL